jgi:SAM-dependent methyltransferase
MMARPEWNARRREGCPLNGARQARRPDGRGKTLTRKKRRAEVGEGWSSAGPAGNLAAMAQPYLSLEAELHDWFWAADDGAASELPLIEGFLRRHPGVALEIGCGSGRLLLPLLENGHAVEGLELSGEMLAMCRRRARDAGLEPVLHEADMALWRPARPYQCVLAPAFTLQLAADPERVLRHWHGWLVAGGGLYLSTFVPLAELDGDLPENEWYDDHRAVLPDGRTALLETRHRLDRPAQTLCREHRYRVSGGGGAPREHVSRQSLRWFDAPGLIRLLLRCGFEVTGGVTDFDPQAPLLDPETVDFDGILTIFCTRSASLPSGGG